MKLFVLGPSVFGTTTIECTPSTQIRDLRKSVSERMPGLASENFRLSHWGRPLRDEISLEEAQLADEFTLDVSGSIRGGGGDGGSTGAESRSSYLEMYAEKKPDKVDPAEERLASWMTCRLSGNWLTPPCCADRLGLLYNKDSVLEAILNKKLPKELSHISAKSLTDLKLMPNPAFSERCKSTANQANFQHAGAAPFVCPVSGIEANGRSRFVVLRRCGTVVSAKALKQLPESVEELVGYRWDPSEVMPLNPPKDEMEAMREALVIEHLEAKARKEKKRRAAEIKGQKEKGAVGGASSAAAGPHAAKRYRASEHAPSYADAGVYASLFTSSRAGEAKETYMCRATSARGMNLT
uniref:Duf602-domain-containing protein n=1 Tax=Tetraselmis sp. GSL018 TaxID=582737 RepID=A0A061R904_9CHLO|mmetsp:Transcript_6190/g.14886  ORF Transcript_6190/g.14886 Transcript_6190/m.14886 type:complete len:353 (-) Transcript_6190:218-1276(-)